jgi:hypothetical protein
LTEFPQAAGSGYLQPDNDDLTAEAIFNFMQQADIPRKTTVIRNVIPSWSGPGRVTPSELRDGAASVRQIVSPIGHTFRPRTMPIWLKAVDLAPVESDWRHLFHNCPTRPHAP